MTMYSPGAIVYVEALLMSYPTILLTSKVRVFAPLFEKYQLRTSTLVVPELKISSHSPPGYIASSLPLGFGSASLIQTAPEHG